ncbi:uncharacterized protein LOC128337420 isoform X2 [Hemicordylus capensis]|uniref:uncharacterized protein LOC128337420 isoform X2 n=1 Tax=Hemicordylus capensis TaxID=884348 RepID=UPI00230462C5|nr:uncharacterized protein LOC128337420 isoform X2 [Hemicordylus capensis]
MPWHCHLAAETQREIEILRKLAQKSASSGETVEIDCDLPDGVAHISKITWYKEEQGKILEPINTSRIPTRSYPRKVKLAIRNVKRSDSGVYYCATSINEMFTFLSGMRLIISDTPEPSSSILVPSSSEGAQHKDSFPLFCLFHDANFAWDTVFWTILGNTFQEQKDGDMIDGEGVFNIWSLQLIPPEFWTQEMSYSCSDQENRSISTVVPTNTVPTDPGRCSPILYYAVPCILILLLIPPLALLIRKHLARGHEKQPANQMPMTEITQDYAELQCSR